MQNIPKGRVQFKKNVVFLCTKTGGRGGREREGGGGPNPNSGVVFFKQWSGQLQKKFRFFTGFQAVTGQSASRLFFCSFTNKLG